LLEANRNCRRFNYKKKIRIKKQGSNYKEFVEGKIKDADGLFEALDKARLKRLGIDNENIKRSEKVQNYTDAANDKIATDAQTANDKK
jgi:hypothetical protein